MSVFDEIDLPASILALREMSPVEDIALAILREKFSDLPIHATIEAEPVLPFVLVRRLNGLGNWKGDPRWIDTARLAVHVFATDPDGDLKAAVISDAIRVALRDAGRDHWRHEDYGSLVRVSMITEPSRAPDWATSSGPVQYADLPTGTWRYESMYALTIRKPSSRG